MRKKLAVIGMAMALSSASLTGCGFEFSVGSEKPIFSFEKKDTAKEKKTEAETEESDELVETTEEEEETTKEEVEETSEEESDSAESSSQYSYYTMNSKVFNYVIGANRSDMTMEVFTDKKIDASDVELDNLSTLINEKGVKYFAVVGTQDMGTATLATLFNAEDEGGEETREEIASQFDGKASDRDIIDGHSFLRISTKDMGMDTDGLDESCFSGRLAMNGTKMYFILTADKNGNADKYMGDFIESMKFNGKESEHEIMDYTDNTSSNDSSQFQSKTLPEDTDESTEAETEAKKSDHVINVNVDTFKDGLTVEGNTIKLGQTTMNQFGSIMAKLGLSEDYSDNNSLGGKYIQYKSDDNNNCIVGMSGEGGTVYSVKVDFNSYGNHKNFEVDGIDASMTRDEAIKIFGEPDYTSDSLLQYNVGDTTFEVYFYDGKLSTVSVANYTID